MVLKKYNYTEHKPAGKTSAILLQLGSVAALISIAAGEREGEEGGREGGEGEREGREREM